MQIGACVSGRSVSLVMCPWFNTFEYFFHRRERALGVYLPIYDDCVKLGLQCDAR